MEMHNIARDNLSLVAIDYFRNFLERWAPRLDIHKTDEDELQEDPDLVMSVAASMICLVLMIIVK